MLLPDTFSKKVLYALRAIFELSSRTTDKPVKVHDIAKAQGIPSRFLEIILSELRQGGFVLSRRGSEGGYSLACNPNQITIGDILHFIEARPSRRNISLPLGSHAGDYAFTELWQNITSAITNIY